VFHISILGSCSFVWGDKPAKSPWRRDWLPRDVYFENRITKPCQLGHRLFGCSAVTATSYVRRLLRWTTLFSTSIAKLYNHFD